MKIGKYFLAGLLMAAMVLPAAAQDKQYDVKLTVYPKEEVQEKGKANKEKQQEEREEYRQARKQARMERAYYKEPVKIERVEGVGDASKTEEVCNKGEAPGIKRHHDTKPGTPVRPQVSREPVGGKCAEGCECCGEGCGKKCDKPCCAEKQCASMQDCGKHGNHHLHGAVPYMNSVQYREWRRKQWTDFEGDRFYLGTNALALVTLAPNVNMEWRRNEKFGLRLSVGGFYCPWIKNDKKKNGAGGFWITPEARWYLGKDKAWYAGAMAQFGYLGNCYKETEYLIGGAGDSYERNIDEHYMAVSVGATLGYMQRVSKKFSVDYNVGVGVSGVGHYDGYYSDATTSWRAAFSPVKVGISFIWQTCSKAK